jgi:sugar phosphate isomerase/epimerase
MLYHRREMLAAIAGAVPALAVCKTSSAEADAKPKHLGVVRDSFAQHIAADRACSAGGFTDPLVFLEHCHRLGAGGVQLPLGVRERADTAKLRAKAEAYQMYLEGSIGLPRDKSDADRFSLEVGTAKNAGASVLRSFMLGGRRYETFSSAESFRAWADRTFESLVVAERIVARQDMRLAVENHKDWRTTELLAILKRLDSRHVGICVDTGNSIALLEDPYEVVEAYAPWAFSTHLKDMAVAEYEQGFLLSEVPLGEGFLDLARIVNALGRARPEVRFNLEMLTRDPLKIPCLTPKYWATFDSVPGRALAQTLAMVRKHGARKSLPEVRRLSQEQKLALEEKNVRQCLAYAREHLGL